MYFPPAAPQSRICLTFTKFRTACSANVALTTQVSILLVIDE